MKPSAVAYMAVMVGVSLVHLPTQAESDFDYALSLTASYSEASQSVRILDKYASFRTGGGGLKLEVSHSHYGGLYLGAGGGYSPKETASFVGANVSGPAKSTFYEYGYSREYAVSATGGLVFAVDYVAYDITGDFSGDRAEVQVSAQIASDISTTNFSLAWRQSLSDQVRVSLGLGRSLWSIEALAKGSLGQSIRATTEARADGEDPLYFIEAEVNAFGYPLDIRYQRSALRADNSVALNAIQLQLRLVF